MAVESSLCATNARNNAAQDMYHGLTTSLSMSMSTLVSTSIQLMWSRKIWWISHMCYNVDSCSCLIIFWIWKLASQSLLGYVPIKEIVTSFHTFYKKALISSWSCFSVHFFLLEQFHTDNVARSMENQNTIFNTKIGKAENILFLIMMTSSNIFDMCRWTKGAL